MAPSSPPPYRCLAPIRIASPPTPRALSCQPLTFVSSMIPKVPSPNKVGRESRSAWYSKNREQKRLPTRQPFPFARKDVHAGNRRESVPPGAMAQLFADGRWPLPHGLAAPQPCGLQPAPHALLCNKLGRPRINPGRPCISLGPPATDAASIIQPRAQPRMPSSRPTPPSTTAMPI